MITVPNMWMEWKDRINNDVFQFVGSGAPTNGTSGTGNGIGGPGSTYTDTTNKVRYVNLGTKASPYWLALDGATVPRHLRARQTTAEINAGGTLLPAISGYKYRITDMAMIAIGGAAATATSVNIGGTQSASAVNLMASAVAGLTQNTLLRAGAANGAILAAGASFIACDENTAITYGKTGSNLATATHVDFLVTYVLEKA